MLIRNLKIIYQFYRRLFLPTLIFSVLLGILGMEELSLLKGIALTGIFILPFFHFIIYEILYAKEYFFYYNLGYSKLQLWILTSLISISTGMLLIFL